MKNLLIVVITLLCTPCITYAGGFLVTTEEEGCITSVTEDQKFDSLKKHYRSSESNFASYNDQSKITEEDHTLIPSYIAELERCRNQYSESRTGRIDPIVIGIVDDMFNIFLADTIKLYNGEISYGEYHRINDKELNEHSAKAKQREIEVARGSAPNRQVYAGSNQNDAQYNAQVRQGLDQMFKSFNPQPPIRTNCYSQYGYTNCTTR
jgi:hypothetical protein